MPSGRHVACTFVSSHARSRRIRSPPVRTSSSPYPYSRSLRLRHRTGMSYCTAACLGSWKKQCSIQSGDHARKQREEVLAIAPTAAAAFVRSRTGHAMVDASRAAVLADGKPVSPPVRAAALHLELRLASSADHVVVVGERAVGDAFGLASHAPCQNLETLLLSLVAAVGAQQVQAQQRGIRVQLHRVVREAERSAHRRARVRVNDRVTRLQTTGTQRSQDSSGSVGIRSQNSMRASERTT